MAAAFPAFLDYCYGSPDGKLAIDTNNAIALHHLSHYFENDSLKLEVQDFVRADLQEFDNFSTYYEALQVLPDQDMLETLAEAVARSLGDMKTYTRFMRVVRPDYWLMVLAKVEETLAIYPEVKGIQVMNDMGDYMYPRYQGEWLPDSPSRRKGIIQRLQTWNPFSNSSPVEGITRAIRTFAAPDKKISLYVFGDEFTGDSYESVVSTVRRYNKADAEGNRRVRIHAVGFPVMFSRIGFQENTGVRFATLMRILCRENGGAFVGLSSLRR